MEEGERNVILRLLAEGSDALHASVAGINQADAVHKPAGGSWSVLDCLEHVAVTESALLAGVCNATRSEARQHNPEREAKISTRALDRQRFIAAPENVVPGGQFASVAQALTAFDVARSQTLRWVETFQDDARCWLTTHPLVRTPVNCWEMLLMIAFHPKRHAQQIAQLRAEISSS